MERLIQSPSSSLSYSYSYKPSIKPISRVGIGGLTGSVRIEFGRLQRLWSTTTTTTKSSSLSSSCIIRCGPSPLTVDSFEQSRSRFSLLHQQTPQGTSASSWEQPKAVGAGAVLLLSVLIFVFVHPFITSQALAAIQTAAKSGGSGAAAVAAGGRHVSTELLSSAWTGFFAGCLHTLSGPDHLAALAPLSIGRTWLESAAVGALWGCGHDAGQVIFGLLFLLLKDRLQIEIIRTWGTRVVGLTLLIIGAMGIKEASEAPAPCVALENGECDATAFESLESPIAGKKKKIGFATFATGIIHGLQPDALMMVLPALALPSRLAGAAFLGEVLFCHWKGLGVRSNFYAEVEAVCVAMEDAISAGWTNIWVECDCLSVVQLFQNENVLWWCKAKYKSLIDNLATFRISHIWREANHVADTLAKRGGRLPMGAEVQLYGRPDFLNFVEAPYVPYLRCT